MLFLIIVCLFLSSYGLIFSKHVLTEDTVQRELKSGKLRTIRFLTKTGGGLPRWAEKFVPHQLVGIIEESVVDPKKQTLTTYTRNIGYNKMVVSSSILLLPFKCLYKYIYIIFVFFFNQEHHRKSGVPPRSSKPSTDYCAEASLD